MEQHSLKTIITRIIKSIIPVTVTKNTLLINDVPQFLTVAENKNSVVTVLSNLFTAVAAHASGTCIRVSAKAFGNVIWLQLKDQKLINTNFLTQCIQDIQPVAENIGGYVGITRHRDAETTIVFSFPAAA